MHAGYYCWSLKCTWQAYVLHAQTLAYEAILEVVKSLGDLTWLVEIDFYGWALNDTPTSVSGLFSLLLAYHDVNKLL